MAEKSLWGNLSDLETVRTPKAILQEQAQYLTEETEGALVGKVDNQNTGHQFRYDLDVCVPSLNNYAYTIVTVSHGVQIYPVNISSGVAAVRQTSCDNENEFEAALGKILSSKEIKIILSRLLSQVR